MNSDGKKVLILGIISIAISAITLYSYNDVKFKNTKKIAEENARLQAEIQSQIDSYGPVQVPVVDNDSIMTGEFSVVLPTFFVNTEFEQLAADLAKQEIYLNFHYVLTTDELKDIVKNSFDEYDLYLIPKDRINGLSLQGIYLGENIKPYFTTNLQNILSDNENIFIPYSLDPLITITKLGIQSITSRSTLLSYMTLWVQTKAFAMPVIWGIGEEDLNLLKEGYGPFENYFEILYWHLRLIKQNRDVNELHHMLNIKDLDLSFNYTYKTFEQLFTLLTKNNKFCADFQGICLFAYNFGDIKFGFLSDLDILERYFSERHPNLDIQPFFNTNAIYPVRVRGFVIPKGNEKKNLSTKFIELYIIQATQGNTELWNNTLPAINVAFEAKKDDEKYKNIIGFSEKFSIWEGDIYSQDKFLSDSKNIDLLNGLYSAEVYINQ